MVSENINLYTVITALAFTKGKKKRVQVYKKLGLFSIYFFMRRDYCSILVGIFSCMNSFLPSYEPLSHKVE